ncbi:MAG: hypothetical protein AUH78_03810 [Gemmatimonadetes bacterium 13_1_40CM_4_69_8]|nr:MAG: hypothetical protein AUH78_03810 [Gemmatimonadetes bacterium 13_1_40CM_4_69_8]PYP74258.1 MAG: hypothetical protein DMD41_02075 [Gemmatimonadota bacterium]
MRRHPIALALTTLLVLSALWPLPSLLDAVTGAPPGDADLTRPFLYLLMAPLTNLLDALTFLSLARAQALVATWMVALALWGLLRPGSWRLRMGRAALGIGTMLFLVGATLALPRPVPRLVTADSSAVVLDYHAHTAASHDGRKRWTAADLADWHAAQGFQASYVTDHNLLFTQRVEQPIRLLPGVEWSVYRQHVVALSPATAIDRDSFSRDTPAMLRLFAELHRQGSLGIASLPEYWDHHREDLDAFVAAGVDGFEIVNCAPKGLAFPSQARRDILDLAGPNDLLVTGASDNHGWGKVTCVWNVTHPGEQGFKANHVFARPLALAQGDLPAWNAAVTQPWLMLRGLSGSERVSWLTWIAVVTLYLAQPRRQGQPAGLGILARSVSARRPEDAPEG